MLNENWLREFFACFGLSMVLFDDFFVALMMMGAISYMSCYSRLFTHSFLESCDRELTMDWSRMGALGTNHTNCLWEAQSCDVCV